MHVSPLGSSRVPTVSPQHGQKLLRLISSLIPLEAREVGGSEQSEGTEVSHPVWAGVSINELLPPRQEAAPAGQFSGSPSAARSAEIICKQDLVASFSGKVQSLIG